MPAAAGAPAGAPFTRSVEVLIVGAGFGGIAAAIELARNGFDDVGSSRAPAAGRHLVLQQLPGRRVRRPSHLYSFSFDQRRHWSRLCSPQAEIHAYMNDVARATAWSAWSSQTAP